MPRKRVRNRALHLIVRLCDAIFTSRQRAGVCIRANVCCFCREPRTLLLHLGLALCPLALLPTQALSVGVSQRSLRSVHSRCGCLRAHAHEFFNSCSLLFATALQLRHPVLEQTVLLLQAFSPCFQIFSCTVIVCSCAHQHQLIPLCILLCFGLKLLNSAPEASLGSVNAMQ